MNNCECKCLSPRSTFYSTSLLVDWVAISMCVLVVPPKIILQCFIETSAHRPYSYHGKNDNWQISGLPGSASLSKEWDNLWKSQGGIIVNGVPRVVPRPKPKGPRAPRVFSVGLPKGLYSPWYTTGIFSDFYTVVILDLIMGFYKYWYS